LTRSKILIFALILNLSGAIGLFTIGSLLPYLQLYAYRLSLEKNNSHQIFSSPLNLRTSALIYICKDVSKRISTNLNEPSTYKQITNQCNYILAERNDSLTYSLLGRLNAITWLMTDELEYLIAAKHFFELSKEASPNNELAKAIETETLKYIQSK
jgi:hypothetical protein